MGKFDVGDSFISNYGNGYKFKILEIKNDTVYTDLFEWKYGKGNGNRYSIELFSDEIKSGLFKRI